MDDLHDNERLKEIEDQLAVINAKISYLIRLLKQNGFKDYEREAAYKANLAMAKEINAKWEEELSKVQDNSKSE